MTDKYSDHVKEELLYLASLIDLYSCISVTKAHQSHCLAKQCGFTRSLMGKRNQKLLLLLSMTHRKRREGAWPASEECGSILHDRRLY